MPFSKGNQLAKGRTTGEMTVTAFEKRSLINYLKEQGADRFLAILEKADDNIFLDKYLALIEFAFPKQARIVQEITGKDGKDFWPVPIMDITKKQLNLLPDGTTATTGFDNRRPCLDSVPAENIHV